MSKNSRLQALEGHLIGVGGVPARYKKYPQALVQLAIEDGAAPDAWWKWWEEIDVLAAQEMSPEEERELYESIFGTEEEDE